MTWTVLTFAFGSVLTSTKMTQLFDNITAMASGDSGAPKIKIAAFDTPPSKRLVTAYDLPSSFQIHEVTQMFPSSFDRCEIEVVGVTVSSASNTSSGTQNWLIFQFGDTNVVSGANKYNTQKIDLNTGSVNSSAFLKGIGVERFSTNSYTNSRPYARVSFDGYSEVRSTHTGEYFDIYDNYTGSIVPQGNIGGWGCQPGSATELNTFKITQQGGSGASYCIGGKVRVYGLLTNSW